MAINYYADRVCLNVLGNSLKNAKDIYEAAEGHVLVGVLTSNYSSAEEAVDDMQQYFEALEGNLSVGLGGGNPNQWRCVAEVAKRIPAHHFNQALCAVGWTRANLNSDVPHVNAMVSPSGTPGVVNIATGPISSSCEKPALVDADTAIAIAQESGANALKFFPMGGLGKADELKALARACAQRDFGLEPTGGIDLDNFGDIMKIVLEEGVNHVIPHIYSSIIDKESGDTRVDDVKRLMEIVHTLV